MELVMFMANIFIKLYVPKDQKAVGCTVSGFINFYPRLNL